MFLKHRVVRKSAMLRKQAVRDGPEHDPALRQVLEKVSEDGRHEEARVRCRRPHVPERVSHSGSRLSQGQGGAHRLPRSL